MAAKLFATHYSLFAQNPASQSCASLTWWSWRGGCTRSHSEHGRETPQRLWYFVLRRGRVGRCQVCKTQLIFSSHSTAQSRSKGRSQSGLFGLKPYIRLKNRRIRSIMVRPLQETTPSELLRQDDGNVVREQQLRCCPGSTTNRKAVRRCQDKPRRGLPGRYFAFRQKPGNAGWSSPVARQAHNLKAAGSNPAPATIIPVPQLSKSQPEHVLSLAEKLRFPSRC